jgi:hypothetical protein
MLTDCCDTEGVGVVLRNGEQSRGLHPENHASLGRESLQSTTEYPKDAEDPAERL